MSAAGAGRPVEGGRRALLTIFAMTALENSSKTNSVWVSANPGDRPSPNSSSPAALPWPILVFPPLASLRAGSLLVTAMTSMWSDTSTPSSALLMNNDRTSVFVATAPWTFERRDVDTSVEEGASVAIRSGVVAGEQVVVKGGILLND